MICYHCQSENTNKAGLTHNQKQRFYCRSCRRFFRENPLLPAGKKTFSNVESLPSASHLTLQLCSISQMLGRTPATADINNFSKRKKSFPLYVYLARFGSFQAALKAANLPLRYKQEFDREKLLDELRDLRRKTGRALIARDVKEARSRGKVSPPYHFTRAFGSVPAAIAAADAARREFSKDDVISYLRKLVQELKRVPTGKDVAAGFVSGETPSLKEIIRLFGSYQKARAAAGISYRGANLKNTAHWQKYTPAELINQLRALADHLGRKPTDRDINAASKRGTCAAAVTFAKVFGSLPAAYQKIGFETAKPREYSDKEIIAALRRMKQELGRMPLYNEIKEASKRGLCPCPGTIIRRIGKLSEINL